MNALKIFQNLEKDNLSSLILLFAIALLFWSSITCLVPTLPSYIDSMGATPRQVGLVMGCFAIGLLLSRIWLGKLADQKSRKLVVLIGTLVGGIAPIGYILSHNIYNLMFVRAFHGISIAAFTTGYSALVVDLSPPKNKGELLGYMSLAIPIGMAVGPALGGFLEVYTSYQVLFTVSSICGFLSFILTNKIRETKGNLSIQNQSEITTDQEIPHNFWQLMINPSFLVPTIILLLIGSLFGTLVTFLPLYIRDLKLDFNAGLFYTAAAIASFSTRFFSGQASDRQGRGLFITISIICYIIAMTLLSIGNSANVFLLAAVFEGMGGGMLIPITLALISDRCSAKERGRVFAYCVSGFDVGVALGGPVLGGFASSFGYRFIFAIAVGMAIIALFVFTLFSNKNLRHSFGFATGNAPDLYALEKV